MATTTLKAASSQPATGVGSLAETNRLLAQGASKVAASSAPTPKGRDELPAGTAYQTYNPDGSVRTSETASQKSASDNADLTNGVDTPEGGIGGELQPTTAPAGALNTPPATPTNTPVDTSQPSPSTVNATPYTSASQPAGDTGTPAQQGHAAALASGAPAPQGAGMGMSAATTAMGNAAQPDTSGVNNFLATNKEADPIRQIMSQVAELQNSQENSSTLMDDYKSLYHESGLDSINAELIHADTVINGTEDDIRNEIQTAGGFGTESQVQAMTLARNKPLLARYNQLAQMKTDATNQLNAMMSLDGQDKQMAQARVNTQIDTLYKRADLVMSMQNAARTQATQLISMVGADGLYAALKNDPAKLAYVEQQVGGSTGWMAQAATQAAQSRSLDIAQKQASIDASRASTANAYSEINARNNPAPKPQTQAQVVAQGYAQRANAANATISKLGGQFTDTFAIGGSLPTILQSPDRQAYEQAKREFINAVLRPESGASISPSEFDSAAKEYFPQQGDSTSAVYNKAVDRQLKINSLQTQGTNTSVPEAGQVITYQGAQYTIDNNGDMTPI